MTKQWIPEPREIVIYNGRGYRFLSMNLAGKCTIKQIPLSRKIGKIHRDIDISELSKRD